MLIHGSDHGTNDQWFSSLDFYAGYPCLQKVFYNNISSLDLNEYVVPVPLDSLNCYNVMKNFSIHPEIVHIDGGHDYDCVSIDLKNWWELLTPNGIMIMDDYYDDGISWVGVKSAVDDFLKINEHYRFEHREGKARFFKP